MANLSLRLPGSLHRQLKALASQEKVSINHLISTAVAEKLSALMTADYLRDLAAETDDKMFADLLARVPAGEPDSWDRWEGAEE